MMGDFEAVQPLIDAYDVLMSDSMNEFDRFAWAYLVLKGFQLSKNDVEDIKFKRVFQNLDEKSAIEFLTKEIPTEFVKHMGDKREEALRTAARWVDDYRRFWEGSLDRLESLLAEEPDPDHTPSKKEKPHEPNDNRGR